MSHMANAISTLFKILRDPDALPYIYFLSYSKFILEDQEYTLYDPWKRNIFKYTFNEFKYK